MFENYFRGFDRPALYVGHKFRYDIYSVFDAYVEQVGQNRVNVMIAAYPAGLVLSEIREILNDIADFDFTELAVSYGFEDIVGRDKFADERSDAHVSDFLNEILIGRNEFGREGERVSYGYIVDNSVEIILFLLIGILFGKIEDMIEEIVNVYGKKFSQGRVNLVTVGIFPHFRGGIVIEPEESVNVIADHMIDIYRRVVSRHEEVISKAVIFFRENEIENTLNNAVYARFQKVGYTDAERKTVTVFQNVNFFAVIVTRFRYGNEFHIENGSEKFAERKVAVNGFDKVFDIHFAVNKVENEIYVYFVFGVEYGIEQARKLFERSERVLAVDYIGYVRSERFAEIEIADSVDKILS